jgi:menaquinone-specific isochorismate synthase
LAGVGVFDLVARLHPTPAVGGAPTAAALDWLTRHGDMRGAWYTGGFGWLDAAGDCDIAVALRCGLFDEAAATLYAGAGFVAGSEPEHELAETEAKFAALRDALDALGAPAAPFSQQARVA